MGDQFSCCSFYSQSQPAVINRHILWQSETQTIVLTTGFLQNEQPGLQKALLIETVLTCSVALHLTKILHL